MFGRRLGHSFYLVFGDKGLPGGGRGLRVKQWVLSASAAVIFWLRWRPLDFLLDIFIFSLLFLCYNSFNYGNL